MASGMIGYCRICAQRNEELVSVFGEDGIYLQLYIKLKVCLQVTVLKNDYLPTAICLQCLTKLEDSYQFLQLRMKAETKFQSYQSGCIDLSNKSDNNFPSVMHGEHKPLMPIKMEEDMFDHPKRRKMRRHLLLEEANAASQSVMEPPQQVAQPQHCVCDTCIHARYGELPLLADVIETQSQAENSVVNINNPAASISYVDTESGRCSYLNVPQVPPLPDVVNDPMSTSTTILSASSVITTSSVITAPSATSVTTLGLPCTLSTSSVQTVPNVQSAPSIPSVPSVPSLPHALSAPSIPSTPSVPSLSHVLSAPSGLVGASLKEDISGPSTSTKKEIACDFCQKTFTHTGDLNKHRRIHTGERPYKCHQCDRKFSHASNLLRHRKIHSGERPFTCSLCGKGFSRKDKMLSHKKSATCTKRSDFQSPGSSGSQ